MKVESTIKISSEEITDILKDYFRLKGYTVSDVEYKTVTKNAYATVHSPYEDLGSAVLTLSNPLGKLDLPPECGKGVIEDVEISSTNLDNMYKDVPIINGADYTKDTHMEQTEKSLVGEMTERPSYKMAD